MSTSDKSGGMPTSATLHNEDESEFQRIEVQTAVRLRPRGQAAGKTPNTKPPTYKMHHKKGAKGPESETTEEGKKKRNLQLKWVAGTMFQEETLSMEYKPSETKRINGVSLT